MRLQPSNPAPFHPFAPLFPIRSPNAQNTLLKALCPLLAIMSLPANKRPWKPPSRAPNGRFNTRSKRKHARTPMLARPPPCTRPRSPTHACTLARTRARTRTHARARAHAYTHEKPKRENRKLENQIYKSQFTRKNGTRLACAWSWPGWELARLDHFGAVTDMMRTNCRAILGS